MLTGDDQPAVLRGPMVSNDGHNGGIYSFNDLRDLGERAALQSVEDV